MAICLCGKTKCRGAFLGYSGNDALQSIHTKARTHGTTCFDMLFLLMGTKKDEDVSTERRNVRRRPRLLFTSLFRVVRRILVTSLKHCEYHCTTHSYLYTLKNTFILIGVVDVTKTLTPTLEHRYRYIRRSVRYFESTVWTNACWTDFKWLLHFTASAWNSQIWRRSCFHRNSHITR